MWVFTEKLDFKQPFQYYMYYYAGNNQVIPRGTLTRKKECTFPASQQRNFE